MENLFPQKVWWTPEYLDYSTIPEKIINSVSINKLKEFTIVPYFIEWYRSSGSNRVSPLFSQEISDLNPTNLTIPGMVTRNPFFDHAQIKYLEAFKNNIPAGRIMVFIDYIYNKTYKDNIGIFGCFESIDDSEVANRLFEEAIKYFKNNSCNYIIGPAKFNASGEIGLLIDGFENKPYFLEPYNAPYYQQFFESYGFKKENDWFSINTDNLFSKDYMDKFERILGIINGNRRAAYLNGFDIRTADFTKISSEITIIRNLYNKIWNEGNHPQQLEMTEPEFAILASGIRSIALQELIFIVEKDNVPIGVSVNIPDINEVIEEYDNDHYKGLPSKRFIAFKDLKRDIKIFSNIQKSLKNKKFSRMRFYILGILKEYRKSGLDSRLYYLIREKANEIGITNGSGSQLADINSDIINPLTNLGRIALKWRVYKLDIK